MTRKTAARNDLVVALVLYVIFFGIHEDAVTTRGEQQMRQPVEVKGT